MSADAPDLNNRVLVIDDMTELLRKPFDAIEVRQLARALTEKWTRRRRVQERVTELEHRVVALSRELAAVKAHAFEDNEHRAVDDQTSSRETPR